MPGGLDPSLATKLAKICGLLGSDQDGERSAAAWHATRLLRTHGMTWADVFKPAPATQTQHSRAPHASQAEWALRFQDRLSEWERTFLAGICRRQSLSARQAAALGGILQKLRQGGAA